MSDTRTIYQAIEEAILEYTDGTGRIYSEQEEGLWNIADRTASALTPAPQVIRTVEELEALDPETIVQRRPQYPGQYSRTETAGDLAYVVRRWGTTTHLPAVVVTPASQVRAARKALEEA